MTSVELALAVVVCVIVAVGATLLYNVIHASTTTFEVHRRLQVAVGLVEKSAAANQGQYPASRRSVGGEFSKIWLRDRPRDMRDSPWGGPLGPGTGVPDDGVSEFDPAEFGFVEAPPAGSVALPTKGTEADAANLCYITPSSKTRPWGALNLTSRPALVTFKNYAIGICDGSGVPWWDAMGGK